MDLFKCVKPPLIPVWMVRTGKNRPIDTSTKNPLLALYNMFSLNKSDPYLHPVWVVRSVRGRLHCTSLEEIAVKGHGNEADFLGVLQKSVWHRFLTLNFEPFRFGLRIRGDIHNRKTTSRESTRMPIDTIFFIPFNKSMVIVHYIPGFFFVKLIF